MESFNAYNDQKRAQAYATLEFGGTYHLAYRDIPSIIGEHVTGRQALDFGCGTGRSTRFTKNLGFNTVGVDIAADMLAIARERDPMGEYYLMDDGDFSRFEDGGFDLITSLFTFDNIPVTAHKAAIFREMKRMLKPGGHIINVVSSPEIYFHEWATFSTTDFLAENRKAVSGDIVRIITTGIGENRPVEDIIFSDESYRQLYGQAGLEVVRQYQPLADGSEPYEWVTETKIAPWVIYVLKTC